MKNQVSEFLQNASRFDPEHAVNVLPDGRTWQWVDPNIATGAETRFLSAGNAMDADLVLVSQWIQGQEHLPFEQCLTPEQTQRWVKQMQGY